METFNIDISCLERQRETEKQRERTKQKMCELPDDFNMKRERERERERERDQYLEEVNHCPGPDFFSQSFLETHACPIVH